MKDKFLTQKEIPLKQMLINKLHQDLSSFGVIYLIIYFSVNIVIFTLFVVLFFIIPNFITGPTTTIQINIALLMFCLASISIGLSVKRLKDKKQEYIDLSNVKKKASSSFIFAPLLAEIKIEQKEFLKK